MAQLCDSIYQLLEAHLAGEFHKEEMYMALHVPFFQVRHESIDQD